MDLQHHGKAVMTTPIHSCGSHTDVFGVGSISISGRNEANGHAIDIGCIYFAEPTAEQRLDADTTPFFSEQGARASGVNRRISRKQADYLVRLVHRAINDELQGVIPSDAEIDSILKESAGA